MANPHNGVKSVGLLFNSHHKNHHNNNPPMLCASSQQGPHSMLNVCSPIYDRLFIIGFFLLTLSACSDHQQDALLQMAINMGRDNAGLEASVKPILDIDMHYLQRLGDGPTVVLVHGFSANKDAWLRFADALPETVPLLIPDLAGHGDSSISDDYTLTRQSERLHALIDALELPAVHIIGSSMGGAISTLYAIQYPERVLSLGLMNAAGLDGDRDSDYFQQLAAGNNPLIATDNASFDYRWQLLMSQPPFIPWPISSAIRRQTIDNAALNQLIFDDMLTSREHLLAQGFEQQLSQRVTMPVYIAWGEEDRVLDVSAVSAFQRHLPHAHAVIYSGVGHVPMLEIAEQSAYDYHQFINAINQTLTTTTAHVTY